MRRAASLALGLALVGAAACGTSDAARPTSTTPTTPLVTTTTLAPTNDPAFFTRERGVLTVATDNPVSPWFERTGEGYSQGLEYDVAKLIAFRLGLGSVKVISGNLNSIEHHIDCRCDLFLGQVRITDELARSVDLSVPYVQGGYVVLTRAGTPAVTRRTARDLRWGFVYDDEVAAGMVTKDLEPVALPSTVITAEAAVHAVATGQVDAALVDAPIGLAAAKDDPTLAVAGRIGPNGGWAAVLPLGSANTPSLNDVIESLDERGLLRFLARQYLSIDPARLPAIPS